jgi:hypothetical protein
MLNPALDGGPVKMIARIQKNLLATGKLIEVFQMIPAASCIGENILDSIFPTGEDSLVCEQNAVDL